MNHAEKVQIMLESHPNLWMNLDLESFSDVTYSKHMLITLTSHHAFGASNKPSEDV